MLGDVGLVAFSERQPRSPAAGIALTAVLGIVIDRMAPAAFELWVGLAIAATAFSWTARSARVGVLALWCGWGAAFGAWHHWSWWERPADCIARQLTETGLSVDLSVRVVEPAWSAVRADGMETLAIVECQTLWSGRMTTAVSGRARLIIDQAELALSAGTQLRVIGRLVKPRVAMNPGDFDYADWLQSQGIEAILRIESPDAVKVVSENPGWRDRFANLRHELRETARTELQQRTTGSTPAVAEALLLGTRRQMPHDLRMAFVESGTLHVLAISGVNVGVIWLGLVRLARGLGWSYRASAVFVLIGLTGYAWLTDANPPIIRAVTFATLLQTGELLGRKLGALQGLSLTLLFMLAWNPADLFNPGAQLSFLSVAALAQVLALWNRRAERLAEDALVRPWWQRGLFDWWWQANLSTGAVWFVTMPLVLWQFHLVSIAGFVLNVMLGPYIWALLWTGYLWLAVLAVVPSASPVVLWAFEFLLQGLIWLTQQAAAIDTGHLYVAGPPGWWVIGFYAVLGWGLLRGREASRRILLALVGWSNVGLLATLIEPAERPLTCDVLSVGHGLACVVRLPSGALLVYDAGSLGNPDAALEPISRAVWSHGGRTIDACVLSHADSDHCNAAVELPGRLSCRWLGVHESFLRSPTPTVSATLDAWRHTNAEGRFLAAGDRVQLDPAVTIEILHPPAGYRAPRDNANSLVVRIEYAGRVLLLTGDLEREGLTALLNQPRQPADFLVAPHHGSRLANPPEFAAWCAPTWVVASASERQVGPRLLESYRDAGAVLNTATCGRVRCVVTASGQLEVTTYLPWEPAARSAD